MEAAIAEPAGAVTVQTVPGSVRRVLNKEGWMRVECGIHYSPVQTVPALVAVFEAVDGLAYSGRNEKWEWGRGTSGN